MYKSAVFFLLALIGVGALSHSPSAFAQTDEWETLLDEDLSKWVKWLGVPHTSVTGLPPGTYQSEVVWNAMGQPLGFNDPKNVFSIVDLDGETALRVSGEIYGVVATRQMYRDYHLRMQLKWGEKLWAIPPFEEEQTLDTGLLFHCQGEHGNSKSIAWRACIEYNIMDGRFGQYVGLGGMMGWVRGDDGRYDPTSRNFIEHSPAALPQSDEEKPVGEWNQLDLFVLRDTSVHVVNGVVVLVVEEMVDKFKAPLIEGFIELQSEASEVYYKDIEIRRIDRLPTEIQEQLQTRAVPLFN
jgi:hypothetical protein